MTGKIFKESSNIYEDEAKVLFDYYKRAAEKIVGEEIDLENKIVDATNRKNTSVERQEKHKLIMIITAAVAGASAVGSLLLFLLADSVGLGVLLACLAVASAVASIINLQKRKEAKRDFDNFEDNIRAFNEAKANIRRDYKVTKMGVAYVPVATRVPFEGKSFVIDHTGSLPNMNFSLSFLHKPQELQESLASLEKNLDSIPVVEGNEDAEHIDTSSYSKSIQEVTMHNYMGNIDREVRNISYLLSDSDTRSVSLPVVPPESEQETFLEEYATTDTGNKPIVKVFDTEGFDSKLEAFTSISNLKKQHEKDNEGGNSNYFKSLIRKLGDSVQLVSKLKTSSTSNLLDYTNSILSAVLKSGYNQYSPQLEAEELTRIRDTNFNYQDCVESYKPFELKESSKVRYDIYNQNWVAEDNTRTIMPFGMNQVEEEVLMPLINNLMNETRIERLKVYNNIKDQKLSYLNKWHQDVEAAFRDNRKSGQELITQITNAYAEYSTAHNTYLSYKQTQNAMKQTGRADIETKEVDSSDAAIKEIEEKVEGCREVGESFQIYMRGLQDDINKSSERFGFVEYFEGSLRDGESKKVADSIIPENLQSLDPRRKKIIPVNSYFATYAELPPEPSVEQKLMVDFTMDLNQVATSQIARIDEENKAPPKAQEVTEADAAETKSAGDPIEFGDSTAPADSAAPATPAEDANMAAPADDIATTAPVDNATTMVPTDAAPVDNATTMVPADEPATAAPADSAAPVDNVVTADSENEAAKDGE